MIVGMGLDIAEIDRIQSAIERHGQPFIARLFTPAEIAYCERHKNKFERYAGRFAVKEATMKALGTGWRHGVRWRDIEVTNLPGGKPTLAAEWRRRRIRRKAGHQEHLPLHYAQRKFRPSPGDFRKLTPNGNRKQCRTDLSLIAF